TAEAHPRQIASHVVSANHRHDIRHDESEKWQEPDNDGRDPSCDGNECGAGNEDDFVVETHTRGNVFPETSHGDAVGEDKDEQGDDRDDPQDLVSTSYDHREASHEPGADHLEQVKLCRKERGECAHHRAEHDTDEWHDKRRADDDAAQDEHEDHDTDE